MVLSSPFTLHFCAFSALLALVPAYVHAQQAGQRLWLTHEVELLPTRRGADLWRAPAGSELTVVNPSEDRNGWRVMRLRDAQGNVYLTGLKNMESNGQRFYTLDSVKASILQAGQGVSAANEGLRPAAMKCEPPTSAPKATSAIENDSLALSARKLLGVYFQDCEAAKAVWKTPGMKSSPLTKEERKGRMIRSLAQDRRQDYLDWHYALSGLKDRSAPPYPQNDSCADLIGQPTEALPIYGYGSKCEAKSCWDSRTSTMNLRANRNDRQDGDFDGVDERRKGSALAAMDCSGFVAASFAVAGLKMSPGAWPPELAVGTATFPGYVGRGCIEIASVDFPAGIKPGDVVNLAANHVVIIDSVGPDPLGIERASKEGDCESISPSSLDFTVTHSGSAGDLGPARFDARLEIPKGAPAMGSKLRNGLIDLARQACEAKKPVRGENGKFSVLRHRSDKEECRIGPKERPVQLKGIECLEKSQCELG